MSLLHRFLISICVTLVITGSLVFFGIRKLEQFRDSKERAAQLLKKEDIAVVFPEGKRREELAVILENKGICTASDFLAASLGSEGYLFPDTYRFFPNTAAREVVTTLKNTYTQRTASLSVTAKNLTLASIVEREAKTDAERSLIAGVYANRLRLGMRLEADPTVQYGKDSLATASLSTLQQFTFWKPITQEEYHTVNSPYNTYLVDGLPPTPIANPGIKSIQAAITPAKHDYLYFLHKKDGTLILARTLSEHVANQGQ